MKIIKRNMIEVDINTTDMPYLPECQASFNSNGNITLRNYDHSNKSKNEIIILSDSETNALFALFSKIGQKHTNYDLPY